jgi:hypothetical protein
MSLMIGSFIDSSSNEPVAVCLSLFDAPKFANEPAVLLMNSTLAQVSERVLHLLVDNKIMAAVFPAHTTGHLLGSGFGILADGFSSAAPTLTPAIDVVVIERNLSIIEFLERSIRLLLTHSDFLAMPFRNQQIYFLRAISIGS